MLFKRRLRPKVTELVPGDRLNEDARDKDAKMKQKGKEYGDDKRGARNSQLKVNDRVLLRQKKSCKTTTTHEHDSYEIVNVNGSQVTVKSGEGVVYKRNSSHVRKFEEPSPQLEQETTDRVDPENSKSQESQTSRLNSEERDVGQSADFRDEVRRSSRSTNERDQID